MGTPASPPAWLPLEEHFSGPEYDARLAWLNPPRAWCLDPHDGLIVAPAAGTDFWRKTHTGHEGDNGHFLYATVAENFVATVEASFWPKHRFDQAGLMIRVSPHCWLKTSVEYEPEGPNLLGAVATNAGLSDWSTQDFSGEANSVAVRIERHGVDYQVSWLAPSAGWRPLRTARLHDDRVGAAVDCGVYACSPTGGGFRAAFRRLRIVGQRAEHTP